MTVLAVFIIVTLALVAAAALSSTAQGGRLAEKSTESFRARQQARVLSETRLSMVDGCIASAADTGLFDINLPPMIDELGFAEYSFDGMYFTVSCTTPIGDGKTAYYWEIQADAYPADRRGSWELVTESIIYTSEKEEEEQPLNVWQGGLFSDP